MRYEAISARLDAIAKIIVDCIYQVHKELGPGLLESVYERCLLFELASRGLHVERQVILPIEYRGNRLDDGLRLDLLVEQEVIIEIKAVDKLAPIHTSQVLTYLKLSGKRLCFLVNFNIELIKDGIQRIVR